MTHACENITFTASLPYAVGKECFLYLLSASHINITIDTMLKLVQTQKQTLTLTLSVNGPLNVVSHMTFSQLQNLGIRGSVEDQAISVIQTAAVQRSIDRNDLTKLYKSCSAFVQTARAFANITKLKFEQKKTLNR